MNTIRVRTYFCRAGRLDRTVETIEAEGAKILFADRIRSGWRIRAATIEEMRANGQLSHRMHRTCSMCGARFPLVGREFGEHLNAHFLKNKPSAT